MFGLEILVIAAFIAAQESRELENRRLAELRRIRATQQAGNDAISEARRLGEEARDQIRRAA